jgi:hypothetical protein
MGSLGQEVANQGSIIQRQHQFVNRCNRLGEMLPYFP